MLGDKTEIKKAIDYFNGWEEGDNITITSDFIEYANILKENYKEG